MNGDTTMTAAEASPEAEAPGLRAHAALIVLGLVNMFNYMDRTVFSVLLESIKSELLLSDAQMGILGGLAYAAFYAIFGLTVGWMADRYHRVRIISTCLAVWSLASIFCGLARSFLQLFFARLSLGAGEAGCIPSAHSIIGDCFPPQRRALAISVFTGIGLIGTLIGLTASGVLLERVGWRNVFILFGLPGLALALLLPLLLKEPVRGRFERTGLPTRSPPLIQAIRSVLAVRTARRLLIATTLYYCIFGAWVWVPTYYLRAYDISAAQFSTLGGLCLGIGSIVGIIVGGILVNALIGSNRLWEFWFPALTALLTAPLFLLVYLTENIAASYVFLFLGATAVGLGMGPSLACMHIVTEHRVRATAIALVAFFTSIFGYGLTPVVIGLLSDGFGAWLSVDVATSLRWAMLCPLLLSIAAALMYFVASRSAHQDEVN